MSSRQARPRACTSAPSSLFGSSCLCPCRRLVLWYPTADTIRRHLHRVSLLDNLHVIQLCLHELHQTPQRDCGLMRHNISIAPFSSYPISSSDSQPRASAERYVCSCYMVFGGHINRSIATAENFAINLQHQSSPCARILASASHSQFAMAEPRVSSRCKNSQKLWRINSGPSVFFPG